jgi:predicted transcriptional regulator YdeE
MTRSEAKEKGATSLCSTQVLITQNSHTSVWFIDSGASHHFCNDNRLLRNLMDSNLEITMGDDHSVKSKSKGTMSLRELSIEAYFVPHFHVSLLSVSQLAKDRYQTTFAGNLYNISKGGKLILRARETDGLYQIDLLSRALVITRSMAQCPPTNTDSPAPQVLSPPSVPLKDVSITPGEPQRTLRSDSIELWHRRLAHLNSSVMKKLLAAMVQYSEDHDTASCDIYIQAKHQQKFERTKVSSSSVPFELIHSDLCSPIKYPSLGGATYYIVYMDDCTKHTEVYFLVGKSSDEITVKFNHYHAWVRAQGYWIKRFRCDNSHGEFNNKQFLDILGTYGISYEPAPPYTQHKNGTAERMIRTINTKARCMLLDSNLPM